MSDDDTIPDLGARLLADRVSKGLSRAKYAEQVGLTTGKISNLEKGRAPKPEELEKLAHLAFVEPGQSTLGVPHPAAPPAPPEGEAPPDAEVSHEQVAYDMQRTELIDTYNTTVGRLEGKPSKIPYHLAWGTPDVATPAMWPRILTWCADVNAWLDELGGPTTLTNPEEIIDLTPSLGDEMDGLILEEPEVDEEPELAIVTELAAIAPELIEITSVDVPAAPVPAFPDDGVRRFSNGQLRTFKRCKREYWLTYYRRLGLATEATTGAAPLGTRVHRCLAVWYVPEGQPFGDPLEELQRTYAEDLEKLDPNDAVALEELRKDVDLAQAMLEGYLQWLEETGADEGLTIVAPETTLEVDARMPEVGVPVHLIAKLDVRAVRSFAGVETRVLVDHKALRATTPVLTPAGWMSIGDLRVGDEVLAPDGSAARVTGVYPQGKVQLNRVTFSDKSSVDTCDEHLWQVRPMKNGAARIMSTVELRNDLWQVNPNPAHGRARKWYVPMVAEGKIDGSTTEMPIPPYVLGALLGDGGLTNISGGTTKMCSADPEIIDNMRRELRNDDTITQSGAIDYVVRSREIAQALIAAGLRGKSEHKFVPTAYLQLPAADRLELLRGLMDTDGCVRTKTHQVVFISTSQQLRDDVTYLARSLGGFATPNEHGPGRYLKNGVKHYCLDVFSVSLQFKNLNPFKLRRKAEHFEMRNRNPKRAVTSIEPIDVDEAVCISVAHPDALYVTKDFIVTHNTVQSFADITKMVQFDEQMLHYHLCEFLDYLGHGMSPDEANQVRTDGAIYNMLRKVKRTASAKPPFYERVEIRHNLDTLRSYWLRVQGTVEEILALEARLDAGEDHRRIAPPNPTRDCSWRCSYYAVCTMLDDGSHAEDMLAQMFVEIDPLRRYAHEVEGRTL